ncbi:MAG: asparaginase, partial [Planctomycetes bacterium]|nr:asparaginase [Planctomycetota bacterium]
MTISRRRFLEITAAGAAVGTMPLAAKAGEVKGGSRPRVVASANGIRGVALAYKQIVENRADPLDAAMEGVRIQELDP